MWRPSRSTTFFSSRMVRFSWKQWAPTWHRKEWADPEVTESCLLRTRSNLLRVSYCLSSRFNSFYPSASCIRRGSLRELPAATEAPGSVTRLILTDIALADLPPIVDLRLVSTMPRLHRSRAPSECDSVVVDRGSLFEKCIQRVKLERAFVLTSY